MEFELNWEFKQNSSVLWEDVNQATEVYNQYSILYYTGYIPC